MAIGTSDGEYYEDRFAYLTKDWQEASNYPNPFEDVGKYTPKPLSPNKPEPNDALKFWEHPSPKQVIPIREGEINYDHHVPLLASAKMDGSGIYVDSRLKGQLSKEEEGLLQLHEGIEHAIMNHMTSNGMSGPKAYDIAHPIATQGETEASRSLWGDAGHEKYKDRMRQFASLASQPSADAIASDAHTSYHGLDKEELGLDTDHPDYHHDRALVHLATNLFGPQHPILPVNPLESQPGITAHPGAAPKPQISVERSVKGINYQKYDINRDGQTVGEVSFTNKGGGHYYLGWAGGRGGSWSNDLGTSVVRQAFRQFIKDNPDATRLSADRISGARREAGQAGQVSYDIVNGKLKLREEAKRDPSKVQPTGFIPIQSNLDDLIRELQTAIPPSIPRSEAADMASEIHDRYSRLQRGDESAARYYRPSEEEFLPLRPDRTADRFLNTGTGMMAGGLGAAALGDTDYMESTEEEQARRERVFEEGAEPVRYLR